MYEDLDTFLSDHTLFPNRAASDGGAAPKDETGISKKIYWASLLPGRPHGVQRNWAVEGSDVACINGSTQEIGGLANERYGIWVREGDQQNKWQPMPPKQHQCLGSGQELCLQYE